MYGKGAIQSIIEDSFVLAINNSHRTLVRQTIDRFEKVLVCILWAVPLFDASQRAGLDLWACEQWECFIWVEKSLKLLLRAPNGLVNQVKNTTACMWDGSETWWGDGEILALMFCKLVWHESPPGVGQGTSQSEKTFMMNDGWWMDMKRLVKNVKGWIFTLNTTQYFFISLIWEMIVSLPSSPCSLMFPTCLGYYFTIKAPQELWYNCGYTWRYRNLNRHFKHLNNSMYWPTYAPHKPSIHLYWNIGLQCIPLQ